MTPEDLVRLRDFGGGESSTTPFGVSPDGARVALEIRRGMPEANTYCVGILVIDLASGVAQLADAGGEWLSLAYDHIWWAGYHNGLYKVAAPQWSPDGAWIAYLKRTDSVTQVWRVRADGSEAAAVTQEQVDIDRFAWTADGGAIVFSTQTGLLEAEAAIEAEGRSGYHYDGRFNPNRSERPYPVAPTAPTIQATELASGQTRPARPDEVAVLDPPPTVDDRPGGATRSAQGDLAWLAADDSGRFLAPARLHARRPGGNDLACGDQACTGRISGPWWSADGGELWYLRREGWAGSEEIALYRWTPGDPAPRRETSTTDLIVGCTKAPGGLLCGVESSTTPRRLVLIDPLTGHRRDIFDPNPEFGAIALSATERLHWINAMGVESYGDLVLPHGQATAPYPLIVVTYETRGFLRGGTGDEYPVQPLANRGFAVLVLQNPPSAAALIRSRNAEEYQRADRENWGYRRNVLASLESGVELLVARGLVDPDRVGLTGLSDGAGTVRFALINSDIAAAASISSCCEDPVSIMTLAGPAYADRYRASGYPRITDRASAKWRDASLALNACRVETPILMQLADREFRASLEAWSSLREFGRPVEMFVFPDEYHVKWQPAHRLAIYKRNLDWFDFWLQDREYSDPARQAEYARWRIMRQTTQAATPDGRSSASCAPDQDLAQASASDKVSTRTTSAIDARAGSSRIVATAGGSTMP